MDDPFVSLSGGNEFWDVQAFLTSEAGNHAKDFRKGQRVDLVCKGSGMAVTLAVARDCDTFADYSTSQSSRLISKVNAFLTGDLALPKSIGQELIAAYIVAGKLPPASACFDNTRAKDCRADAAQLIKTKDFKGDVNDERIRMEAWVHYSQ